MGRTYLVDGYNVLLTDPELDDLLDAEGLAAARQALREEAMAFARSGGDHIRIIYDGAVDPMNHDDRFENAWVEDSFTSRDEKADERLVALSLEYRRKGVAISIVSDDREGVRAPLAAAGFTVLGCAEFARLIRGVSTGVPREKRLSPGEQAALADVFLARDAEVRRLRAEAPEPPPRTNQSPRTATPAPRPSPPKPAQPQSPDRAARAREAEARAREEAVAAGRAARKERGLKKQARRLALIQSRRSGR